MKDIPRITSVTPLPSLTLLVTFTNGVTKQYDVTPLLSKYPAFESLKNPTLFNLVRVDAGGFGIVWNDEIDLSEYEIWKNGKIIN